MPSLGRTSAIAISTVLVVGCSEPAETPQAAATAPPHVETRVDSIIPIEEAIRRFKSGLPPGPPAVALEGGTSSRDELVQQFIHAVEVTDTAALVRMNLNAREFIDLYYPFTKFTKPPYQLDPAVVWLMLRENSEKGLRRIVQRMAGLPFGYEGYACAEPATVEGDNRIWENCRLKRSTGEPREIRLFGGIIERAGHYKIFTYANDM
jgi:hypothetical protein